MILITTKASATTKVAFAELFESIGQAIAVAISAKQLPMLWGGSDFSLYIVSQDATKAETSHGTEREAEHSYPWRPT